MKKEILIADNIDNIYDEICVAWEGVKILVSMESKSF